MKCIILSIVKSYLELRFTTHIPTEVKEEKGFISIIADECCVIKFALAGDTDRVLVEFLEENLLPMKERKLMSIPEIKRHFIAVLWDKLPMLI